MSEKNIQIEIESSEFFEHMRSARKSMVKSWKSLVPDGFWEHRRNAKREVLLAFRSVVDGAIDRIESPEQESAKPKKHAKTKKKVEIAIEKSSGEE